jgi:hypothetical protein
MCAWRLTSILLFPATIVRARAEERNRLQSPYTAEQEEEIRQAFLLEKLASYTKTLQDEDIDGESHSYLTPVTEAATESNIADTEEGDNGEATGARLPEAASSDDEQPSAESAVVRSDLEMGNVENDVQVDDSDHFEDDTPVGEFQGTGNSFITVPVAGQTWPLLATEANHAIGVGKLRRVTNGCAVCLCEYEKGDRVTWASNSDCTHVFHEECILNWLLASGRKKQRRRHNNPRESTGDPIRDVTTFPMICPCCRQQYVSIPEGEPEPAVGTNNLSSRAEEGESTASAMELGAVDEGNEAQA